MALNWKGDAVLVMLAGWGPPLVDEQSRDFIVVARWPLNASFLTCTSILGLGLVLNFGICCVSLWPEV